MVTGNFYAVMAVMADATGLAAGVYLYLLLGLLYPFAAVIVFLAAGKKFPVKTT